MGEGIYLAGAAMAVRCIEQDALVHNLANSATPGFKAARVFRKVLDEVTGSVSFIQDTEKRQEIYIDFSQGPVESTGRDLDFALEGDGFFVVVTPEGERFTRNGSFTLDGEGRLVDPSGSPVLIEGEPINVAGGKVVVDKTGEIFVGGEAVGRFVLRHFASMDGLTRAGPGLFSPRPGIELQEAEPTAIVRQGCLEGSNVSALDEMNRMILVLKGYEASQRMVQMQDEVYRKAVNDLVLK